MGYRVYGISKRLLNRKQTRIDVFTADEAIRRRQFYIIRETAVGIDADYFRFLANMFFISKAILALGTKDMRFRADPIADFYFLYFGADLDNFAA